MFFIGLSSSITPHVLTFLLLCGYLLVNKSIHIQLFKHILLTHFFFTKKKQIAYKQINKITIDLKEYLIRNKENIWKKYFFIKKNNDFSLKFFPPRNKYLTLTLVNTIANNPPPCSTY